jgi:hypothetical protein
LPLWNLREVQKEDRYAKVEKEGKLMMDFILENLMALGVSVTALALFLAASDWFYDKTRKRQRDQRRAWKLRSRV